MGRTRQGRGDQQHYSASWWSLWGFMWVGRGLLHRTSQRVPGYTRRFPLRVSSQAFKATFVLQSHVYLLRDVQVNNDGGGIPWRYDVSSHANRIQEYVRPSTGNTQAPTLSEGETTFWYSTSTSVEYDRHQWSSYIDSAIAFCLNDKSSIIYLWSSRDSVLQHKLR